MPLPFSSSFFSLSQLLAARGCFVAASFVCLHSFTHNTTHPAKKKVLLLALLLFVVDFVGKPLSLSFFGDEKEKLSFLTNKSIEVKFALFPLSALHKHTPQSNKAKQGREGKGEKKKKKCNGVVVVEGQHRISKGLLLLLLLLLLSLQPLLQLGRWLQEEGHQLQVAVVPFVALDMPCLVAKTACEERQHHPHPPSHPQQQQQQQHHQEPGGQVPCVNACKILLVNPPNPHR